MQLLVLGTASLLLAVASLPLAANAVAKADSQVYRVGPGDVLEVEVWREPDLSGRYTVDPSGSLPHVLAGAVPASGATLVELSGRLREALERDYLREARVSVALVESARSRASVLGEVESPGLYPIQEDSRLLGLIFEAGGITDEAADQATILRLDPAGAVRDGSGRPRRRIPVDLGALMRRGDLTQNPGIVPGDVVVVEARPEVSSPPPLGRVRLVGEVRAPGVYPLSEATTLLDAVLAAGGLSEYAAANRSRLVRGAGAERIEKRLRLGDVMQGRANAENLTLRDGDIIVVPESFF